MRPPIGKPWGLSGQCIGILLMALALTACGGSDTGTGDGEFSSVSAGFRYTCGVQTGGSVACWGIYGQARRPRGNSRPSAPGGLHTRVGNSRPSAPGGATPAG